MRSAPRPRPSTLRSRLRAGLASVLVTGLALLGVTAGVAVSASAHTPTVSADCVAVHVQLTGYDASADNSVTVTIDGTAVVVDTFRDAYSAEVAAPSGAAGYTWAVDVVAHDDPAGSLGYTRSFGGEVTGCGPTAPPTPSPSPSNPPTEPSNPPTPPGEEEPPAGVTPAIALTTAPCTVGSTGDDVTDVAALLTDLTVGDSYRVSIGDGSGADAAEAVTFEATATTRTVTFTDLLADAAYTVVVLDMTTGLSAEATVDAVDCDVTPPDAPVLIVDTCSAGETDTTLHVDLSGLTVGSTYSILLDGVQQGEPFVADRTMTARDYTVEPGTHTVGIRDEADPYTVIETDVDVPVCSVEPTVTLSTEQCSTADGPSSLGVTLSDLLVDHLYRVELLVDGVAVDGHEAETFVATTASLSETIDLPAGHEYTVRITDVGFPQATATASATLEECPEVLSISVGAMTCDADGDPRTGVWAQLAGLTPGDRYTVTLREASSGSVVGEATGVTSASAQIFTGLTAGLEYVVTATSEHGAGTASASVTPTLCDLPTFPLPPEPVTPVPTQLETLALTGTDESAPGIVALVLVQAGIALLLVTSLRRRRVKGA